MLSIELIFLFFLALGLFCGLANIGMSLYLGKRKIKEIDRVVFGYEISNDNLFYLMIRLPRYGGAFAWRWSAKRADLLEIRDHFDKKFQRPFIVDFWLMIASALSLFVAVILNEFFLHME